MKPIRCLMFILIVLLLAGCDASLTEEDISRTYREWFSTLLDGDGQEAASGSTRVPAVAEIGRQLQTPVPATPLVPINEQVCNLAASGMPIDMTIPDGTRLRPGQSFSKTWRLINAGGCTWGQGYSAVWFSGDLLGAARIQFLRSTVLPGQPVDITVEMTAPKKAGIYQSNWKLSDPQANLFGIGPGGNAPFWVIIEVIEEASTPTPSVTPTITLTPVIYSQGEIELALEERVDLDSGEINQEDHDDLSFLVDEAGDYLLAPVGSAKLLRFGVERPGELDCRSQALSSNPIPLEALAVDDYVCYHSGQSLPGYFRLTQADLEEGLLRLEYLTWAIP